MRIAIYHNLPSGGAKRALYEIVKRLAKRHGLDVYTLSCADHEFCDLRPYAREHIVYPFGPLPLARRPLGRLNQGIRTLDLLRLQTLQRRIARAIDARGHDVVFAHHGQYAQAPALLRYLGTPSVYFCHEPPRHAHEPSPPRPYSTYSRLQRWGNLFDPLPGIYRRTLKRLDRESTGAATQVLVNSHYSRESLYRTYGLFARVAYLGVDTDLFRPSGLARGGYVLCVGALNPHKGFDFLIQSLALLPEAERPDLVVVSNAVFVPEQAYLERLAEDLGVHVTFRIRITDEELVRLYSGALLTVYAPIMEPFGFVPLESMACGTPVLGVREGGVRETVVHGETGWLTERDPEAFAEALRMLLQDEALRRSLGARGSAYVREHWSWERSVACVEAHLESVVRHGA